MVGKKNNYSANFCWWVWVAQVNNAFWYLVSGRRYRLLLPRVCFPTAVILAVILPETNLPNPSTASHSWLKCIMGLFSLSSEVSDVGDCPRQKTRHRVPLTSPSTENPTSRTRLFSGSGAALNCSKPSPLLLLVLDEHKVGVLGLGTLEQ